VIATTAEKVKEFDATVWVDLYGDYLFAVAFARLRDEAAAERMVQETLLAALACRDSGAEYTSEKTWLGGILKDKIIDFFRRRFRGIDLTAEEAELSAYRYLFADETWKDHWTEKTMPVEWQMTPEQALERGEFCAVLENCLGELPARVANCFTLHEMDGFQASEICEILQVSKDNYRLMLHRARTHLRRCLEYDWFRKITVIGDERSCLER
jgi:RNA polymerase sigma-70 factor (TIGR02943 family)